MISGIFTTHQKGSFMSYLVKFSSTIQNTTALSNFKQTTLQWPLRERGGQSLGNTDEISKDLPQCCFKANSNWSSSPQKKYFDPLEMELK